MYSMALDVISCLKRHSFPRGGNYIHLVVRAPALTASSFFSPASFRSQEPATRLLIQTPPTSLPPPTTYLPTFYKPQPFTLFESSTMSRHHPDLVMCRKQPGISIGRLCDKCDGKCPVCDSYVRPTTLVRICDECAFGNYQNKCVVCGGEGISDAFYCFECTRLEKDRDGCPKIINLGSSRTDLFYQKKSFRNH